ncbi:hypothetical protein, partial [Staphylococcus epidermidis]
MTQFYSIKEVANLSNKHKSTLQTKLTKNLLQHINNQILPIYKKPQPYNHKTQLFFNQYPLKYIITL